MLAADEDEVKVADQLIRLLARQRWSPLPGRRDRSDRSVVRRGLGLLARQRRVVVVPVSRCLAQPSCTEGVCWLERDRRCRSAAWQPSGRRLRGGGPESYGVVVEDARSLVGFFVHMQSNTAPENARTNTNTEQPEQRSLPTLLISIQGCANVRPTRRHGQDWHGTIRHGC